MCAAFRIFLKVPIGTSSDSCLPTGMMSLKLYAYKFYAYHLLYNAIHAIPASDTTLNTS